MRASVVIRSYNRYQALAELLGLILGQKTSFDFEVVVVDQTTHATPAARTAILALARDPRVAWLTTPPLGGPAARNLGVRASVGEIIILIDDDDLPIGDDWLARHVANFADPQVIAVTGGERLKHGREPPYRNMPRARRRVLSLSPLMWQRVFCRIDVRKPVESVRGSNVAIRRSLIERVGLWDTGTRVEDELSFCYRLRARRRPAEIVLFDPAPRMLRRMDIPGGMDKRAMSVFRFARRHFDFFHGIVAHYHPWRFVLLYPVYALFLYGITADWRWDDVNRPKLQAIFELAGLAVGLPLVWLGWLASFLLGPRGGEHEPGLSEGRDQVTAARAAGKRFIADNSV
jgi:glycosyltransferase involved in cell wall biosynthesis